jgi:hypothetical protein
MSENFNPCVNVTPGAEKTLAPVFGGSNAGGMTANTSVE